MSFKQTQLYIRMHNSNRMQKISLALLQFNKTFVYIKSINHIIVLLYLIPNLSPLKSLPYNNMNIYSVEMRITQK